MEKIKRLLPLLFLFIIIASVYHVWFGTSILSGGDFGMNYPAMNKNEYLYPFAWYWNQGIGLGGNAVALLMIYLDFALTKTIFGQILGFPWNITERLAYFFPFLILGLTSSLVLAKSVFPKNPFLIFSAIIFLVNSYILMVVGGGQLWIFLSYAITPFIIYLFIKEINFIIDLGKRNLKKPFFIGLVFSLQFLIDLRIAYITLFAAFLYWLFKILQKRKIKEALMSLVLVFLIPGVLTFLIHAFWILPTFIIGQNPLDQFGSAFTSANAVNFFSFARFENSISLLHPNWPENIFGKVYFMKPEFLLLPILAFSSLFFISKTKDQITKSYVLFFALLGLIGAFLAKGSNDPFGAIYLWMFNYVPGFVMFRDPTKWYTLVAVSYSILIPFTIWKIYEWLEERGKFSIFNFQFSIKSKILNPQNFYLIVTVFCLLYLIRPALLGQLGGTFKATQVPSEYVKLESFFSSQKHFFRTFWVPSMQRFGLNSVDHPAISSEGFYGRYGIQEVLPEFKEQETDRALSESAVKYVIVPYDSEGEIYLKDRRYDESIYKRTLDEIREVDWLKELNGFGKIAVFEVSNVKNHFWSPSKDIIKNYKYVNPTKYVVEVKNARKGEFLVFSESFDSYWQAQGSDFKIGSSKFHDRFNSFKLPKDGSYKLTIYYTPQDWVNIGLIVSGGTTIFIIGYLIVVLAKKNNMKVLNTK